MCHLPKNDIGKVYEFILQENYHLEGNSFSVYNSDIILGSVLYSDDIQINTTDVIFKRLLEKSKTYYDTLIKDFGCEPCEEEE